MSKIKNIDFSELDDHTIHENPKCEIPLELKYQISNVLTATKEAIEKLKISLILPKIVENPQVLEQYLKDTEYENCLHLVYEYRKKRKPESLEEPNREDFHIIRLIDYFQENHKILQVLPNWLDDIDNTEKCLLKAFEDIHQIAQERFYRPATADLAKEKHLHEVYLANEQVKKSIKESSHRIQNHKLNQLWKTAAKTGVIKQLEDELAFHQYDNQIIVKGEISKCYGELQKINAISNNKQQELQEELNKTHSNYEKKLKSDLIEEKNIRDERNKLQLQLQALIGKYDQTMLDKYKDEIFLNDEYERQKQELDNILIEYKREDAIYEELVRKKEREAQRLHEAKVVLFTHNRAAKKIQRWWKKYLRAQKQKLRELTKKGKGKSQNKENREKSIGDKKSAAKGKKK